MLRRLAPEPVSDQGAPPPPRSTAWPEGAPEEAEASIEPTGSRWFASDSDLEAHLTGRSDRLSVEAATQNPPAAPEVAYAEPVELGATRWLAPGLRPAESPTPPHVPADWLPRSQQAQTPQLDPRATRWLSGRSLREPETAPAERVDTSQPETAPTERVDTSQPDTAPTERVDTRQPETAPPERGDTRQPETAPAERVDTREPETVPQASDTRAIQWPDTTIVGAPPLVQGRPRHEPGRAFARRLSAAKALAQSGWLNAPGGRAGRSRDETGGAPPEEQVEPVAATVPAVEIESDAPPPVVEDADAEARARDRYRRAVRAFFNELCDEPLASGAAAEALAEFAGEDDSQLWDRGATADDRLLQIARATAHRHGLGPSDRPDAG